MTQEDIIRMAREAGCRFADEGHPLLANHGEWQRRLFQRFATLVAAAQREKVAHWMRNLGYATGHGDTMEEMLDHLGTQIAERLEAEVLMERKQYEHTLALQKASYEREIKIEVEAERAACADICDQHASIEGIAQRCAEQIRARSKA